MNRQLGIAVLATITILIIVATIQPLLPVREDRFSELGVLGPTQTIGGYPTRVVVNQSFLLYGLVVNHEGIVENYRLFVKLGNQGTPVTNATYAVAPVLATYWRIVDANQNWLFPMNLTIGQAGVNTKLIFELWSYDLSSSSFAYKGLWNQILINVTLT
jgi:uncharacterized membrane protein